MTTSQQYAWHRARMDAQRERRQAQQPVVDASKTYAGTPNDIIAAVARDYGLTPAHIYGVTKTKAVVRARRHAMWAVKQAYPDWSSTMLARKFGCDHTTILYSIQCHTKDPRAAARRLQMKMAYANVG